MNLNLLLPLLVLQAASPAIDPSFDKAAMSCKADGDRLRAIAGFFELAPDQTIAEFQPLFALTDCLADAVHGRGKFVAIVDGGDRVEQVVWRVQVQKAMKRDAARYASASLIAIKPGKPVPAEQAGSVGRVVISGQAPDLLRSSRGIGLLRALRDLTRPAGILGIVDVPDAGGVDVAKLNSAAQQAGWEPAGQTSTGPAGLLLLKFRKS